MVLGALPEIRNRNYFRHLPDMARVKIVNVVGARPQFVKMAVVSRALKSFDEVDEVIIHSGQHYDDAMSQVFFDELHIPKPDYNLGIAGTGGAEVVEQMQRKLETILQSENPHWVVVYGDTYTTLAAARAAKSCGIRLAHVEAGLRSFNDAMPEEFNRVQTDRISDLLFAPTAQAVVHLKNEQLDRTAHISQVGDVMFDAARYYAQDLDGSEVDIPVDAPFLLCTIHRAENTDDEGKLRSLAETLNRLSEKYSIVLPLHPRTEKRLKSFGLRFVFPTHPPQSYRSMLALLQKCALVLTDSGGLQKEAFFMKRFCLTLRSETEWTELVHAGYNKIVGTDSEAIINGVAEMIAKTGSFSEKFYGEGNAGDLIAAALVEPVE